MIETKLQDHNERLSPRRERVEITFYRTRSSFRSRSLARRTFLAYTFDEFQTHDHKITKSQTTHISASVSLQTFCERQSPHSNLVLNLLDTIANHDPLRATPNPQSAKPQSCLTKASGTLAHEASAKALALGTSKIPATSFIHLSGLHTPNSTILHSPDLCLHSRGVSD